QLVARARAEGVELTGDDGLLTAMIRQVLQTGLEVELSDHLGYEPHDPAGRGSGNSRNGTSRKTVTTDVGDVELAVPRDRNAIVEDMALWQRRPLDRLYPVLLIDAIVIKVRDSQVANRPVYVVIGVNMDGERDVLGLWLGPTGGEGAKQWMTMLTELRNRGIADALIVCCDGLKGLPEAIRATWPDATVQTCVVHLVRNSLRYASKKYWGQITRELREIYTAPTVEAAEVRFGEFAETWRETYPAMISSWENSWSEFVPFLEFPVELRKIVYTTNAI